MPRRHIPTILRKYLFPGIKFAPGPFIDYALMQTKLHSADKKKRYVNDWRKMNAPKRGWSKHEWVVGQKNEKRKSNDRVWNIIDGDRVVVDGLWHGTVIRVLRHKNAIVIDHSDVAKAPEAKTKDVNKINHILESKHPITIPYATASLLFKRPSEKLRTKRLVKYVKDPETQEAKRVMFDRQSGKQVNRKFKIQERKTREVFPADTKAELVTKRTFFMDFDAPLPSGLDHYSKRRESKQKRAKGGLLSIKRY